MRAWLNAILSFIGSTSLTDLEYAGLNVVGVTVEVYDQASYDVLAGLLEDRESVSSLQERLIGLYAAKGFTVEANVVAKSNIYIGDVL